jgi:hypothetical protein
MPEKVSTRLAWFAELLPSSGLPSYRPASTLSASLKSELSSIFASLKMTAIESQRSG